MNHMGLLRKAVKAEIIVAAIKTALAAATLGLAAKALHKAIKEGD